MSAVNRSVVGEMVDAVASLVNIAVTTAQGLLVTARYLGNPSEIVTFRYPRERLPIAPNFRGRLINDSERCISCELCVKVCPTGCIVLQHEIGADKKRILTGYKIDMTICLYCGLCTEVCPASKTAPGNKSLNMSGGYEYSSDTKESICLDYRISEKTLALLRAAAEERAAKAAEAKRLADEAKATAAKKAAESAPAVASAAPEKEKL